MFGMFKSKPYLDPELGRLLRSRGYWRTGLGLQPGPTQLVLSGHRDRPDAEALVLAKRISTLYRQWLPEIEAALFEHYAPYAAAAEAGAFASDSCPPICQASQVRNHAELKFIAVAPLGGVISIEFGYTVAWDQEHTLGVRFQNGRLWELCGSVLEP